MVTPKQLRDMTYLIPLLQSCRKKESIPDIIKSLAKGLSKLEKNVESLEISETKIIMKTHPVFLTSNIGKKINIGKFALTLRVAAGECPLHNHQDKIYSCISRLTCSKRPYDHSEHPHICIQGDYDDPYICFGNIHATMGRMLYRGEFDSYLKTFLSFLHTYNFDGSLDRDGWSSILGYDNDEG